MQWPKIRILTQGNEHQAIAPLVLSASRATDIPAFHAKWFMNRLRQGYCVWENPFNRKQKQYISFKNCKVIVFWSKNPTHIIPFLSEIDTMGIQYYFQYTLNDYEQELLEPYLPKIYQRLSMFKKLSERIGKHRVIWRFDPLIMSGSLTVDRILQKIKKIAEEIAPYTEKFVFSYLDWYKKTERAVTKLDNTFRSPTPEEMLDLATGITDINAGLPSPLRLATCAEEIDLSASGITRNSCVDDKLILRLCPDDKEIVNTYGNNQQQLSLLPLSSVMAKDTGQRAACGCVPSKDIGSYNTCMHLCAYCYANQSEKAVITRMNTLNMASEKL